MLVFPSRLPLLSWPGDGRAPGPRLGARVRRWPAYLVLVGIAPLAVGFDLHAPWQRIAASVAVNIAQPLFAAALLQRLGGPVVQIDTIRGLGSLFIGLVLPVGAMSALDAGFTYLHTSAPFKEQWSVVFVSTLLGMLLTAPLILAWSRRGIAEAVEFTRVRLPELLMLYMLLIATTYYVFGMRPSTPGFLPQLIYLCAPFFIWAALRFGLRATTLALGLFRLIVYWQTARGFGPFSIDGIPDLRSMLHLQGYIATIIVTSLFAAALLVEREEAVRETGQWRNRHAAGIRASGNLLYEFNPSDGTVPWDGGTLSVLGVPPQKDATVPPCLA